MKEVNNQEKEVQQEYRENALRVYRKESKFKDSKNPYWYSATLSDGRSVNLKFKEAVPTDSAAFEIFDIVGTMKTKKVEKNNETYENVTYYVSTCKFQEIKGEPLPL